MKWLSLFPFGQIIRREREREKTEESRLVSPASDSSGRSSTYIQNSSEICPEWMMLTWWEKTIRVELVCTSLRSIFIWLSLFSYFLFHFLSRTLNFTIVSRQSHYWLLNPKINPLLLLSTTNWKQNLNCSPRNAMQFEKIEKYILTKSPSLVLSLNCIFPSSSIKFPGLVSDWFFFL